MPLYITFKLLFFVLCVFWVLFEHLKFVILFNFNSSLFSDFFYFRPNLIVWFGCFRVTFQFYKFWLCEFFNFSFFDVFENFGFFWIIWKCHSLYFFIVTIICFPKYLLRPPYMTYWFFSNFRSFGIFGLFLSFLNFQKYNF